MVTLVIDNKTVCVPEGTSILDAARTASIDIPTLCYLKDLNEIGACRICMVEIEGQDTLVAACDNEVHEGMVIHTNSQKVRMTRRVNLQLLLSQHEVNWASISGTWSEPALEPPSARQAPTGFRPPFAPSADNV